jgi:hypothetical protein
MNNGFFGFPGPTKSPYRVYSALFSQTGSYAPVPTVLENNIGNVWFTYENSGSYKMQSNGLFVGTIPTVTSVFSVVENITTRYVTVDKLNNNSLRISSFDYSLSKLDNLLNNTPVEIRIYP